MKVFLGIVLACLVMQSTLFGAYETRSEIQRKKEVRHKRFSFEEEMTPSELKDTGVETLTPQEQRNLEEWVAEYISRQLEEERAAQHKITDIQMIENLVVLDDGSSWKVSSLDKNRLRTWRAGQKVEIQVTNNLRNPYRLLNTTSAQSVAAELLSGPTESQVPRLHRVETISRNGDYVTLEDGSLWKVTIFEKAKVRRWQTNDQVEIRGVPGPGRAVLLYNKKRRESVNAEMLYGPQPVEPTELRRVEEGRGQGQ